MRDVLEILIEIVLAIAGAVFFGSLTVVIGAIAVGCLAFASCCGFLGWRRRRTARARERG